MLSLPSCLAMYSNLLAHLQRSSTSVDFETIEGTLSHHLAHLSPLPTPLAASAVSAPLFLSAPITLTKLDSLSTSFRHAIHLKYELLNKDAEDSSLVKALFSRSCSSRMAEWVDALMKGLQGGRPIMRLACATGVLMGLHDFANIRAQKSSVENEVVLSLAEVMDQARSFSATTSPGPSEWEIEFRPIPDRRFMFI